MLAHSLVERGISANHVMHATARPHKARERVGEHAPERAWQVREVRSRFALHLLCEPIATVLPLSRAHERTRSVVWRRLTFDVLVEGLKANVAFAGCVPQPSIAFLKGKAGSQSLVGRIRRDEPCPNVSDARSKDGLSLCHFEAGREGLDRVMKRLMPIDEAVGQPHRGCVGQFAPAVSLKPLREFRHALSNDVDSPPIGIEVVKREVEAECVRRGNLLRRVAWNGRATERRLSRQSRASPRLPATQGGKGVGVLLCWTI